MKPNTKDLGQKRAQPDLVKTSKEDLQDVYMPSDDSYLIQEQIKDLAAEYKDFSALDLGTGSGILAKELSHYATSVIAIDINQSALDYAQKINSAKNITWIQSNLFDNLKEKLFDIIICNPPYLPKDKGISDPALYGGKNGYEYIVRLISEITNYLRRDGTLLLLFSSFSKPKKIFEALDKNLFEYEKIASKHIFFEDLFVYRITKSKLLKAIDDNGITNTTYLAQGKRGILFTGKYNNEKVTIKLTHPRSDAKNRIEIESSWLKRLSKEDIGPEYLFSDQNMVVYRYIDGVFIEDFVSMSQKSQILVVLRSILEQLYILDTLGIDKEEMHRPYKNLLIQKDTHKPILIDFERANYTQKPKNVAQFCQFLSSTKFNLLLQQKQIFIDKDTLRLCAASYKKAISRSNFNRVLDHLLS